MRISDFIRYGELPETVDAIIRITPSGLAEAKIYDNNIIASFNHAYLINKLLYRDMNVFLRKGMYIIKETINVVGDHIGLIGEHYAHNPGYPINYIGGTLLVADNDLDTVIQVGSDDVENRNIIVFNIGIHGNKKASTCMKITFTTNGYIGHIFCMYAIGDGLVIGSGSRPVSSTLFYNIRSVWNDGRGVYVSNAEHCYMYDFLTVENGYHGYLLEGYGNIYMYLHSMVDNRLGYNDGTGIKFYEKASTALYFPKVEGDGNGHPIHGLASFPNTDNVTLDIYSPFIVRVTGTALGLGIANRIGKINIFGGAIGNVGTGIWVGSTNTVDILVKGLRGNNVTTPLSIGTPDKIILDDVIINGVNYSKGILTLSGCANIPSSGAYVGQIIACYDSTASKWVLKLWDGTTWQTIG